MTVAILLVLGGLVLLSVGGDWLVDGATRIALLARLSATVVGLTVVAMGTSLPELAVSLDATLKDVPDISFSNIVGSNVFNVGAILAIAALLRPFAVRNESLRMEYPFMVLVLAVGLLLARDGVVDRLEGGFFLFSLVAFIAFLLRLSRDALTSEETAAAEQELAEAETAHGGRRALWIRNVGLVAAGIAGLVIGAELIVSGAVRLAEAYGVSERVIGLTIVAMGTSLPELGATFAAARKGQPEIAFGNVIGSNIFNVLAILGTVALVRPVPVNPASIAVDNWVALGLAVALFFMMWNGRNVTRANGAVLMAGFLTYMGWVVVTG